MEDEPKGSLPSKPIRPFLTGIAIAAGWGAVNVPANLTAGALGELAASIAAIALVAGGGIAAAIEVMRVAIRYRSERFRP